jgi:hypothetical protein
MISGTISGSINFDIMNRHMLTRFTDGLGS